MIYQRIKEACQQQGLSIRSLEQQAGLSNGSISKWVESSPTVDSLTAVTKVLGITMDDLCKDEQAEKRGEEPCLKQTS